MQRWYVTASSLVVLLCLGASAPALTHASLRAGEVAWVALGDDVLVSVWADGAVGAYDTAAGQSRCFFRLERFNFRDTALALAPGKTPMLACLTARGDDTECSFYDLQSGQCQDTITLKDSAPIDTLGFSASGRSFFCASSANNAIFRISTATRQVSRYSRRGLTFLLPQYGSDGKAYASFAPEGSAIARTWKGQTLWTLQGLYPLSNANPLPSSVVFLSGAKGRDVRAVNFADGKEIWRDGWMDGKHVLACSADGRQLALWEDGQLQLVWLSGQKKAIGQASKKTEACFSPDSQRLLYLPSLEINGDDAQRQPVLKRTNSLACLVDCRTGQIVKRYSLKQPAMLPSGAQGKPAAQTKPAQPAKPIAHEAPAPPATPTPSANRPARKAPQAQPAPAPAPSPSGFD